MGTPVVFTKEQIHQMANKPFDVYDKDIRRNMEEHQARLDAIAERDAARQKSMEKWITNESRQNQPDK